MRYLLAVCCASVTYGASILFPGQPAGRRRAMTFSLPGFDLAAFVRATLAEDLGEGGDLLSAAAASAARARCAPALVPPPAPASIAPRSSAPPSPRIWAKAATSRPRP